MIWTAGVTARSDRLNSPHPRENGSSTTSCVVAGTLSATRDKPVLFVNPRSGGGAAERSGVVERARELGIEAVVLAPGQSLAALAQAAVASGADALGMAGGDGSLAVVAGSGRCRATTCRSYAFPPGRATTWRSTLE